jgi:hypothetical protein
MKSRICGVLAASVITLMFVTQVPARATETEVEQHAPEHPGEKHAFHKNHFGGFVGASTHSDNDETAFTLGLEYARQFSRHWAISGYVEQVSGALERDIILLAGVIFYPLPRLGIVAGPGFELADKQVDHHGEVEEEGETEWLFRVGAAYGFSLGQAGIGPAVFIDWNETRWTAVYGISMVTGF